MCGKKADGVCALCLVTRFCKSCFENKHKNSPFEEDPNNIHKLTLYVIKNISILLKPIFFFLEENPKNQFPVFTEKNKTRVHSFSWKTGGISEWEQICYT